MHSTTSTLPCGCSTRDDEGLYCNADCGPPSCLDCYRYEGHCICDAALADILPDPMADGEDRVALIKEIGGDEFWREIFADDLDYYERHKADIAAMRAHQERPFEDGLPQWWETPPDLDNLPPDPPALLARADGKLLLPRDAFIEVFGAPGSGKSWLALLAIAANIATGGRSLLWLWEGSPISIYRRLRLLGVPDHLARDTDLLRVAVGAKHPTATIAAGPNWVAQAAGGLAIIDTTAQAGGASNDAGEATEWMHSHIAPWRNLGATVIAVDHDTKTRPDGLQFVGSRGSGAKTGHADLSLRTIGHKKAQAGLRSTLWTSERDGHAHVVLNKDRESWLAHSQGGEVTATLRGTWHAGAFRLAVEPPTNTGANTETDDLDERIVAAVHKHGTNPTRPLNYTRLLDAVGPVSRQRLTDATQRLHDEGRIVRTPFGRGLKFTPPDAEPEAQTVTEAAS